MIKIRHADARGYFDHGWLQTHHTFSFADYYDPDYTSFRALRVMNEDRVRPGHGFNEHGHKDMEIVTYVLEGALEHRDSLGNGEVLRPGEFQRMSAGRGIRHSEFNPSKTESVHLYQIWLLPERPGLEPSYEQKAFDAAERENRFRIVASPTARDGSLRIHQDAEIFLATLADGAEVSQAIPRGRHAWLQVLRGSVGINGEELQIGDGAAISDVEELSIRTAEPSEVMLFDLA
ncbi:MAG: pirin family protein [Planctomyces sp.]|nr:pirin family protein [Planctomyces sp.]